MLWGQFELLAGYAGSLAPTGMAMMERYPATNTTGVHVQVLGLSPDATYPVHVHAGPCVVGGLGHYKLEPSVEASEETNELWPALTSDASGVGHASLWHEQHLARGDALSIVVHDPVMDGEVSVELGGLDAAESYSAHLHDLPCDVADGGGHYKVDPTVEGTEEGNELWLDLSGASGGMVTASASDTTGPGRLDAQSVVVHRAVPGSDAVRVACASLVREGLGPLVLSGGATHVLAAGSERGYEGALIMAGLSRGGAVDQRTLVSVGVIGLSPDKAYTAHVHNRPCSVDDGGGHYKLDPSIEDTLETNEIWIRLEIGTGSAAAAE